MNAKTSRSERRVEPGAAILNGSRWELRDWYSRRLRPKVVGAATSGAIPLARAVELERLMSDLLASAARS